MSYRYANVYVQQYDIALRKYGSGRDPILLSCLGRVWYAKGKKEAKLEPEKSYESLQKSLGYAKRVRNISRHASDSLEFPRNWRVD